jgi:nucleoside-diphosphate-sugar epimerase
MVGLYARERGVPATVLRYFTVYGPRQRPEMALARFVSAAIEGRSVEIFGDGDQVREMTYVSDVVGATVAALAPAPRTTLRTYNVGGGTGKVASPSHFRCKLVGGCGKERMFSGGLSGELGEGAE